MTKDIRDEVKTTGTSIIEEETVGGWGDYPAPSLSIKGDEEIAKILVNNGYKIGDEIRYKIVIESSP